MPYTVQKGGPTPQEAGEILLAYDANGRLLSKTTDPTSTNVPPEDQLPNSSVQYGDGIEVTNERHFAVYTPKGGYRGTSPPSSRAIPAMQRRCSSTRRW